MAPSSVADIICEEPLEERLSRKLLHSIMPPNNSVLFRIIWKCLISVETWWKIQCWHSVWTSPRRWSWARIPSSFTWNFPVDLISALNTPRIRKPAIQGQKKLLRNLPQPSAEMQHGKGSFLNERIKLLPTKSRWKQWWKQLKMSLIVTNVTMKPTVKLAWGNTWVKITRNLLHMRGSSVIYVKRTLTQRTAKLTTW